MFCGGDIMINLPESTFYNKKIPKQKFYDKLNVSKSLESLFIKEIESIIWKNKISHETINVSKGKTVAEIEVFEINLKGQNISQSVIEFIDREIPYHLIFILKFKDMGQICISYKEEKKSNEGKFKVDTFYKTEWQKFDELELNIEGLDLDKVYENLLVQIADGKLNTDDGTEIKYAVEKNKEREKLEEYIRKLENKVRNEKQFNRQVALLGELRKAKKQLEVG
jgi:hypothetical protein